MPYNLRKRKAVTESEVKVEAPAPKKKKAESAKPVLAKVKLDTVKKTKAKAAPKVEPEIASNLDEKIVESKPIVEKKKTKATVPKTKAAKAEPKTKVEDDDGDVEEGDKLVSKSQLVFGEDTCGELGQGEIGILKKKPIEVKLNQSISAVVCGPMHTLSLTSDGVVYSCGCNDEGALGRITDGDETLESTPTPVSIDGKVIKISAGDSHSAALTDAGKVLVWGNFRDEHGSVGLTPQCNKKSSFQPIEILPEIKFKDIASGSNHMLLLDVDGAVYSFGVGAQGQLGRLTVDDVGEGANTKPITEQNIDLFLRPQKVNLKNVDPQRPFVCDAIFAGNFSSFATNTDKKKNRLAGWGLNNYFQLGYKGQKGQLVQHVPKRTTFTCSTSIVSVACGHYHTLFLTRTGRVSAAGRNEYGMLGLGGKSGGEVCPAKHIESLGNSIVDIAAGINTSFAVSNEGSLYAWGMSGASLGVSSKDDTDLVVPTMVESLKEKKVHSVSTGGSTFTSVLVKS